MSNMKDRQEGFERKFALDEELRFKATARRNKALGLWAAGKLSKSGEEAEAYSKDVVMADLKEAGDEDVIAKLRADFDAAGVNVSDAEIRTALQDFLAAAVEQLKSA